MKLQPFNRAAIAVAVVAGSLLFHSTTASAQGFAIRTGANVNPDQFTVGGQYELGPVAEHVWVVPNAELGFGNGATLVAMNFDGVYRYQLGRTSPWKLYAGGGPSLNFYKLFGYDRSLGGVNALGGLAHDSGFFAQFTRGFYNSPQYRMAFGYAFHPVKPIKKPVRRK